MKYGLIGHEGILSLLETGDGRAGDRPWPHGADLLELVERCVLVKQRMVLHDERDAGDVRIALNLGHTVSHALEAATGYRLRHGEAVAYGLRAALGIGVSMHVTPPAVAARAIRILDRLELGRAPLEVRVDDVLAYVQTDKKRSGGKIRWVLVSWRSPRRSRRRSTRRRQGGGNGCAGDRPRVVDSRLVRDRSGPRYPAAARRAPTADAMARRPSR